MTTTVYRVGPIFDGKAEIIGHAMVNAIIDRVGQEGVNRVHQKLGQVLQHPTGYYQSQIQTSRQINSLTINDGQVIYGPWLEGVGSRNATTRFKGYFTFRQTSQTLNRDVVGIADAVVGPFVKEMNGV